MLLLGRIPQFKNHTDETTILSIHFTDEDGFMLVKMRSKLRKAVHFLSLEIILPSTVMTNTGYRKMDNAADVLKSRQDLLTVPDQMISPPMFVGTTLFIIVCLYFGFYVHVCLARSGSCFR